MLGQMWYNSSRINNAGHGLQPYQLCTNEVRSMSPNSTIKCKKCGNTERYKNGASASCARERSSKWYHANPDKASASSRKWKQANPDKVRAISRRWARANPDKMSAKYRKWHHANLDKERARKRKWKRANPDKRNASNHIRRARERQAKSEPYNFKAICKHYDNRCVRCGKKCKLTIDHIKSLALGGDNIASNIQPLCLSCNSSKGARNIDYRPDSGPLRWIQKNLFARGEK